MDGYPPLEVKVWGEFACFTRPEMKVERVTYPVMTPSAARGVLEAIFWKPEFRWRVRAIEVLRDIAYFSLVRNEVKSTISPVSARRRVEGSGSFYAEDDRTQRNTLALRDVAYVIRADVELRNDGSDPEAKYRDQFRRRVQRGQCFHQPYLGCREFSAYFGPVERDDSAIDRSERLGRMLFDMTYAADGSGGAEPIFFEAALERGVLHVPLDPHGKVA